MKYPTTSKTLLDRLRQNDEISWNDFFMKYQSVIRDIGMLYGLSNDECSELVQCVMIRFFQNSSNFRFDAGLARFRTYFSRIVKNCACDVLRKRSSDLPLDMLTPESEQCDDDSSASEMDRQFIELWRKTVLDDALDELRRRVGLQTYQIFELYVLQQRSAEQVALVFQVSQPQVYLAKCRCIKTMRQIIRQYNRDDAALALEFPLP